MNEPLPNYDRFLRMKSAIAIFLQDVENDEHGFYARGIARSRLRDNQGAIEDLQKAAKIASLLRNITFYQQVQEEIKNFPCQ